MQDRVFFREAIVRETGEGAVLVGNRCPRCEKVFFPKVEFCSACLSENLEEKEIAREGIVYATTVTRVPVERLQPPHALGIIKIPEDRLSITAPLVMEGDRAPGIGARVAPVIAVLWEEDDGTQVYGYKFKAEEGV